MTLWCEPFLYSNFKPILIGISQTIFKFDPI